jgi:hypothetical protein
MIRFQSLISGGMKTKMLIPAQAVIRFVGGSGRSKSEKQVLLPTTLLSTDQIGLTAKTVY